jgi:hypothetical protein
MQEREKLIKFIKQYIKKHNKLPPTTLEYYKFVKVRKHIKSLANWQRSFWKSYSWNPQINREVCGH